MHFTRFVVLAGGMALAVSQAWGSASATSVIPMEEPVAQLSPPPSASPQIAGFELGSPTKFVTATPLLCANTAAANGPYSILPAYYSAKGRVGASPMPFVFGASSTHPMDSAVAYGATNVVYNGNQLQFAGDPLEALVCYGLDANGVRRVGLDLFADNFEVAGSGTSPGNSTVSLSVFSLPAGSSYYGYTVDVTIPPLPQGTNCNVLDCNFTLMEGYDTSVFSTSGGGWCKASAGAQYCQGPTTAGNININYANYGSTGVSLAAPIAPAAAVTYHFVVFRSFKSGVSTLPAAPVVMAALFSPLDLREDKLDDNVAVGDNTLSNAAPSVVVSGSTYTTFTSALTGLQEATDTGSLLFNISDADTADPASGPHLDAAVKLNLPGGIQVPLAANCTTISGSGLADRQCAINIPLANAAFWNAFVAAQYQGQFNNVATDTIDGTYANGVSAGLQIIVTDAQGKSSAPVSLPVHIFSTKNDAPAVTFNASQMPSIQNPNDNNALYSTYSCSVSAGAGAGGCGSANFGFIHLQLMAAINALPGPAAAFDELASQTTAVVPYTDPNDAFTNVQCTKEQTPAVFYPNGSPVIAPSSGSSTSYDMDFLVSAIPPTAAVSALCILTTTDAGFPNGQSAVTTPATFRVVVNP